MSLLLKVKTDNVNMCLCYMSACDTLQTDMHVTIIDMHIMVMMFQ